MNIYEYLLTTTSFCFIKNLQQLFWITTDVNYLFINYEVASVFMKL